MGDSEFSRLLQEHMRRRKVSRGELTQELGTTTLTKATKMPKPARAVAHRGWYTKGGGTSQNSRQAVRNAFGAGFYGCEIDVHQTTDGYIMVNHDFSIGGVTINLSTYDQVKDKTLSNGEKIPQLSDLFAVMKDEYPDSPTKLVIELKVNANTDTLRLANSVVQAVREAGMQDRVQYISFGVSALRYVRAADPTASADKISSASARFFSCISTIRSSIVSRRISRYTVTTLVCPIRCARSVA